MSDLLKKLIEERSQLQEKYLKLWNFLGSENYENLSYYEKDLLKIQYSAMETYLKCLDSRVYCVSRNED